MARKIAILRTFNAGEAIYVDGKLVYQTDHVITVDELCAHVDLPVDTLWGDAPNFTFPDNLSDIEELQ